MRSVHHVSAVAIVLLLLGAGIPVVTAAPAEAAIVSPSAGAAISAGATVVISYVGHSPAARNASGYLTLDGVPAGTFVVKAGGANGTTINATLRPESTTAAGEHMLGARVFTEIDAPVDAPAVAVTIDSPPTISDAIASYDEVADVLHIQATVSDDSGGPVTIVASIRNDTATTEATGAIHLTIPILLPYGFHSANLSAEDASGQRTQVAVAFRVDDRAGVIDGIHAEYRLGGTVRVTASVADRDGIRSVTVWTQLGMATASHENGTWIATVNVTPRIGSFNGSLTLVDGYGHATRENFTFTIGGTVETIFERSVTTHFGAHVDVSQTPLPSIAGGAIEICFDANCSANTTFLLGGTIVASGWNASIAAEPCVAASETTSCAVTSSRTGGWLLELAWDQAPLSTVTVRIRGVRV